MEANLDKKLALFCLIVIFYTIFGTIKFEKEVIL